MTIISPANTQTPVSHPDNPDMDPVEYRVTFGQGYRRVAHPTVLPGANRIHPDGWVTIVVRGDTADARTVAFQLFGPQWCDIVPARSPRGSWGLYPLGELARYDCEAGGWVGSF